jgi:hypothetical protein
MTWTGGSWQFGLSLDGKGKGWPDASEEMKRLKFLDSRSIPSSGASGRKPNDINAPSAIRLSTAAQSPLLLMLLQCDNYIS